MQSRSRLFALAAVAGSLTFGAASGSAQSCDLAGYKAASGLSAAVDGNALVVTWEGDRNQEIRLRLSINSGTPIIQDLSIKPKGGQWSSLAANMQPAFHVKSGYRRMTEQQLTPMRGLGPITPEIVTKYKWEAFWDSPLNVPGALSAHGNAQPPTEPFAGQLGMPRTPDEINSSDAVYQVTSCAVKTDGQRIEISYPGVKLGVFEGKLQYTVYKGTNLIKQEIVAQTHLPSVAYKYDAGLKGLVISPDSKVAWRDTANVWQGYQLEGTVNTAPATLYAANRIMAVQSKGGSIAAFTPPHNFFWARELSVNLGYDWYSKDSDSSFSFGIRQPEIEIDPAYSGRGSEDRRQNFALRSARPETWQRMPIYLYVDSRPAQETIDYALAYTRQDHYQPLPGYMVMATHFHTTFVKRLLENGGLDTLLPDLELVKNAGVNIFAPIDGGANGGAGSDPLAVALAAPPPDAKTVAVGRTLGPAITAADHLMNLDLYYKAARLHSGKGFLVMPNEEITNGDIAVAMGGHNDLFVSHPVYWTLQRAPGQPFTENDPKYGKVYHIGSPADLMQMAHLEDLITFMPHPRSKGSTGYPDAIKESAHFNDSNWRGVGFRWGMGLDGSETRLCDYRCMPLFDDMNNWVADKPTPPKYMQAITETYQQGPGDDFYANNPVNYIKLNGQQPGPDNWKPIVDAMKNGNYFVTSGEVLIPNYAVEGTGNKRTVTADIEWTFPLDFAEVVWGDGQKTDRQIIPLTDLRAFGKHHFAIPFDATGKKWVRFAVWDSAGNGAFIQPIKLPSATPAAAGSN